MNPLTLPLAVLFHPLEAFRVFKGSRDGYSVVPGVTLLALAVAVRIAYVYLVHFPLAVVDPREANIWAEVFKVLVPVLTWIVSSYALTAILDGEMLLREVFTVSAYCMLPYVLLTIPLAGVSHLLSQAESALYGALQSAVLGWVFALLFVSVMTMNDYGVGKAAVVCAVSLVGMFLVLGLALVFYTLTSQFVGFLASVAAEIRMMLLE